MPQVASLTMVELEDMVGGGAYPTYKIPGFGVDIEFHDNALEKSSGIAFGSLHGN